MKDFLRRVIHGFAFGLGIAAALAVGIYVASFVSDQLRTHLPNNDVSKIAVTFVRDATTSMGRAVVGTVLNSGSSEFSGTNIVVDFYDTNGHIVDTCSDYLSTSIKASATASFKISCGDPDAPKLAPHASFKVRLGFTSDEGGP